MFIPKGSNGVEQNVLAVASRRDHLFPLASVGTALGAWSAVDQDDWGLNADEHRQGAALSAGALTGEAMRVLKSALDDKRIDPLVCSRLMERLEHKKYERIAFSSDWEYAAIMYGVLLIPNLQNGSSELMTTFFGDLELSKDTIRKDLSRGREYLDELFGPGKSPGFNCPNAHRVELTEKYLNAALPHLIELDTRDIEMRWTYRVPVTLDVRRVTPKIKKSANEKKCRPSQAEPITALPAGFFTRP